MSIRPRARGRTIPASALMFFRLLGAPEGARTSQELF